MQTLDIIILIVLGVFFLFGFVRGFIKQLGAIAGFFVALWAAGAFYQQLLPYVKPLFKDYPAVTEPVSIAVSYIGVYIGVSILFHIFVRLLDQIFRIFSFIPLLKATNRLLGGIVGFLEGLLLASFIILILTALPVFPKTNDVFKKSFFVPWLNLVSNIYKPFIPDFKSLESLTPEKLIDKKTLDSLNPGAIEKFIKQYKKGGQQEDVQKKN